jgi:hypothetical protein
MIERTFASTRSQLYANNASSEDDDYWMCRVVLCIDLQYISVHTAVAVPMQVAATAVSVLGMQACKHITDTVYSA